MLPAHCGRHLHPLGDSHNHRRSAHRPGHSTLRRPPRRGPAPPRLPAARRDHRHDQEYVASGLKAAFGRRRSVTSGSRRAPRTTTPSSNASTHRPPGMLASRVPPPALRQPPPAPSRRRRLAGHVQPPPPQLQRLHARPHPPPDRHYLHHKAVSMTPNREPICNLDPRPGSLEGTFRAAPKRTTTGGVSDRSGERGAARRSLA